MYICIHMYMGCLKVTWMGLCWICPAGHCLQEDETPVTLEGIGWFGELRPSASFEIQSNSPSEHSKRRGLQSSRAFLNTE